MNKRFGFSRRSKLLAGAVVTALAAVVVGVALAADVPHVFDHFDSQPQSAHVVWSGPTSATSSAGTGDPLIMGGERDLALYATVGGGEIYLLANDPVLYPTELSYAASSGQRGYAVVKWDGENNDPLTLNPIGLRAGGPTGIDVTNGGLYTGLNIVVTGQDLNATLVITIYTDAANYMRYNLATTPTNLPKPYYIPFASFTSTGSPSATNVGAVVMTIDGTAIPSAGLDMVFHVVEANGFDFGDLPTGYNNITLLASNGARHLPYNLYLGSQIDVTSDGNPSINATGDDSAGSVPDDEDGVTVVPTSGNRWLEGTNGGTVSVNVTGGTGCLTGWIDWNGNSSFGDAGDLVINSRLVSTGANPNLVTFNVPAGTFPGTGGNLTFNARFRLKTDDYNDGDCNPSSLGGFETDVTTTGVFWNGEVEDYQWGFYPTAVTLNNLEATADTQNNTAVLILAASVVAAMGLAGVVMARRRTA